MLLGLVVSLFLARRLKRDTFGRELDEIADMLRKVQVIAVGRESLRQVIELVARVVPMGEVFPAIAQGVGRQAYAEEARVYRYEADGWLHPMAFLLTGNEVWALAM